MKILFLDDDPLRHDAFDRQVAARAPAHDVYHVSTASAAIRLLVDEGASFDLAFLDHDLQGMHYVTETLGHGPEVAACIAALPRDMVPKKVVVHSFNVDGGPRMAATINAVHPDLAEYIPFSYGRMWALLGDAA